MISTFIKRLKNIFQIVKSTPNYLYILFLSLLSAIFTFVGIPLLVPALEFLKTDIPSERNLEYLIYIEKGFQYFNIVPNFYSILLVSAFFLFTGQFLLIFTEVFNKRIQIKLIASLMTELITRYYNTNWSWIASDQSGRFHSAITREVTAASETHLCSLRIFISFIQTFIYIILAFYLSSALTSWIITCFFLICVVNIKFAEKANKISLSYNNAFISLTSQISGLIQNKKFFKASTNYKSFMQAISDQIKNVYQKDWRLTLLQSGLRTFTMMTGTAFILLIFLFHSYLKIGFTELLVILLIFARLAPQFNSLVDNYNRIAEKIPVHDSVMNRIKELKKNVEKSGDQKFEPGKITKFENVSCSYVKDQPILKNINIDILPFQATAIVGSSGAGKSTFLDLFLGLLAPDTGKIFYGNIPQENLDKDSLRKKVAYVGQETTLLDGSLKYNLTISNSDASNTDIFEACKKAKVDQFINELPNGLNTQVGENGIKLSGGQRQRVALARALLTNPEILILDEATSNLDVETEEYIKEAIKNLRSDLTIIIVTHRLSTVKVADKLYVLEKGKVVESGTFNDLLEKKGRLAQLESIQAS